MMRGSISTNMTNNKGFTLIEMLVSTITITIVTSLLLVVTDLANKTYVDITKDSEGQILSGVLTKSIEDEFRYATDVVIQGDEEDGVNEYEFTYFSQNLGLGNSCKIISKEGKLYVHQINDEDNSDDIPLTSDGSYAFGLTCDIETKFNIKSEDFHIKLIIKDDSKEIITKNFVVIPLNPTR